MSDAQPKLTKKERHSAILRYMAMGVNNFNYETQQGPSVVWAFSKVLRKIYPDDDEYVAALDNHFKYFNTTTAMAGMILGATLAMEERDGIKSKDAVQALKTSLMGPFAGVGDTIIWILLPTIMGSIAGYMALQGNPLGAIIWILVDILLFWIRIKLFDIGYDSGVKLVTTMANQLSAFTEAPHQVAEFVRALPLAKIPGVGKVSAAKLENMGLRTCGDVQNSDLAMLLKRFGKFGRILWERSHGIDEREIHNDRQRKSVGVERTLAEDIHEWPECEAIIENLYPELERRLAKVKPDLLIARQGIKLKFNDFQLTTQEHVWPRLNKEDLIATAHKAWDERRGGRGVRLVGLHVTLLDPQLERQLLLGI